MRTVRLKNFRSMADTGRINLRPVTVLVGANSSGKSSFLRFFPLLRQTFEAGSASPLLWYGRDVDFGSFSQAVRRGSEPGEITIEFGADQYTPSGDLVRTYSAASLIEQDGKTQTVRYRYSSGDEAFLVGFDTSGACNRFSILSRNQVVQEGNP